LPYTPPKTLHWLGIVAMSCSLTAGALASGGGNPATPVAGWTTLTPSPDSRIVYVSSSVGDDNNDGLSESTPKQTIAAGWDLIRDGYPDWILLKCGDVWVNQAFSVYKSGRSASEKLVIGSYGDGDRPLLLTGMAHGVGGEASIPRGHVAITDLHLLASGYNGNAQYPPYGIRMLSLWDDVLIENCYIEKYLVNIDFEEDGINGPGGPSNIAIRRCVIADAYATTGSNSEGLFVANTNGLLLEENIIDHNGWSETISGAVANNHRQNVYIHHTCSNVTTRGNISARASHCAMSQRPGGICENNLILKSPLGIQFGTLEIGAIAYPSGAIRNNVVLDTRDINPSAQLGIAMWVTNGTNLDVTQNILAQNNGSGGSVIAMNFDTNAGTYQNVNIAGNIVYKWYQPDLHSASIGFRGGLIGGVSFCGNDVQQPVGGYMVDYSAGTFTGMTFQGTRYNTPGNFFWGQTYQDWLSSSHETGSTMLPVTYPSPDRTIGTYMMTLGGAPTLDGFMTQARLQSRSNWHSEYTAQAVNNYVRAGFGRTSATCAADLDGNGRVDVNDAVLFQTLFLMRDSRADANHDGQYNVLDFVSFQQLMAAGCP
jgi:hypothetical protein